MEVEATGEAGADEAPAELDGTAVLATAGMHDAPAAVSTAAGTEAPAAVEEPKTPSEPEKGEDPVEKRARELADEREAERVKAKEAEDARAKDEEAKRTEAEKANQALVERRELVERAQRGDTLAQEKVYELGLQNLLGEVKAKDVETELEPKLTEVRKEYADKLEAKWAEHTRAFGLEPDDKDFAGVPAEKGLLGLNEVAIKKTATPELIEAMKGNPAIKDWVASEVAKVTTEGKKDTKAAAANAMAKTLGQAPKADGGKAPEGAMLTGDALDAALLDNPSDPDLLKAWTAKERAAGRYW